MIGGKSYNDIMAMAKDVTDRRQKKYKFAQFSGHLQKFIHQFETLRSNADLSINVGAEKIYGIKRINSKIDSHTVQQEIRNFFRNYTKYRVHDDLLQLFNNFYKAMNRQFPKVFEPFNEKIDWTDKNSFEPYFNMLKSWFYEEEKSKKESKSNKNDLTQKSSSFLRDKTLLETQFEQLLTLFHANRKYVVDTLDELHQYIKENKELSKRFGEVPTFRDDSFFHKDTGSSTSKNINNFIEPTLHVIRFYWISYQTLTYIRHLYNCNELFTRETKQLKHDDIYIDDGYHQTFDYFMERSQENPLNMVNETCQLYMEKYGMNCSSVRYLMAYKLDVNYQSYIQSGYYELTKTESFNSFSRNIDILLIDNHQIYAVTADEEYRDLIQIQTEIMNKYSNELKIELDNEPKYDYRKSNGQEQFVSFYEKPFHNAIIEWIEGYVTLTNEQSLLQHLNHRFYLDGCHLTPFELQYILLASIKLQKEKRCDIRFILLLCSSVVQCEIINVLLYMEIVYHRGQRFYNAIIYEAIQLIESARHKALFAVKLREYDEDIDVDQIYRLILMLQHSSNGSEQLEKMTLHEWIDVANKQKWSEIGALIKKYGEVGYYLGFLDDRGRKEEERLMRQVFDSVQFIPEILIAKVSQFIANNEVHANEDYFNKLRLLLESGNDFTDLEIFEEKRPYLITREFEQQKFIKYISNRNPREYEALLPSSEREIDDMLHLLIGLHDNTDELKSARKDEIRKIGDMLKV